LSKLSQLKQKAYQAGKNRNWDEAIAVYEKILELEKSNPTVINEVGDLCLKAGNTGRAVKHFLSAASKYRKTGLLNNSVAIYKKILRHDEANLHAHWYLAETRASQGLTVEGEEHAHRFLAASEKLSSDLREVYHKRCIQLFELYPGSTAILESLVQIFRMWTMPLEEGRAMCLLACNAFDAGDQPKGETIVGEALAKSPELANYHEYNEWLKRVDPASCKSDGPADYNSVALDVSVEPVAPATAPVAAAGPTEAQPIPAVEPTAENFDDSVSVASVPDLAAVQKDDEGCISIDADDGAGLDDLIAEAAGLQDDGGPDEEVYSDPEASTPDPQTTAEAPEEKVDLLAQILAEDSGESRANDSEQLATITSEIGMIVGGDGDDDAGRLYEMGMVYLEMGMFDQACESFEVAAADEEYCVRAYEMWGITLQRANRPDEAVTVLTSGMEYAEQDSREELGLRYHVARAHEMAERADRALTIYEKIHQVAPGFLDVGKRLAQLSGV
jgi:tetratricopeptide (TPR) repeat protein